MGAHHYGLPHGYAKGGQGAYAGAVCSLVIGLGYYSLLTAKGWGGAARVRRAGSSSPSPSPTPSSYLILALLSPGAHVRARGRAGRGTGLGGLGG